MKTTIYFIQISLVIFILSADRMLAQGFIPEFQMPIYFEDAIGNLDTVVVGYDTSLPNGLAWGHYNPLYDGSLVNTPFDSVFEIRVFHMSDQWEGNKFTTKKITVQYDAYPNSTCGLSEIVCFAVRCKYPPLTIRYDSTLLGPNTCRGNTTITHDNLMFFIQYWWNAPHVCMGYSSEIQPILSNVLGMARLTNADVEGLGKMDLPGQSLVFRFWGACTDSTLIVNTNTLFQKEEGIHIFPNPATDRLNITESAEGIVEWSVYNILGQLEYVSVVKSNSTDQSFTMETSGLPPGTYFLLGKYKRGVKSLPFVVQRQ